MLAYLSELQDAIRSTVRDQLVPILRGSLVSAREIEDLARTITEHIDEHRGAHGVELLDVKRLKAYVDEEDEADGSTSWKVGLRYVLRVDEERKEEKGVIVVGGGEKVVEEGEAMGEDKGEVVEEDDGEAVEDIEGVSEEEGEEEQETAAEEEEEKEKDEPEKNVEAMDEDKAEKKPEVEKRDEEKDKTKDKKKVEKKQKIKEQEWEIVAGTWKQDRTDAVSSFVAAVQHMGYAQGE